MLLFFFISKSVHHQSQCGQTYNNAFRMSAHSFILTSPYLVLGSFIYIFEHLLGSKPFHLPAIHTSTSKHILLELGMSLVSVFWNILI